MSAIDQDTSSSTHNPPASARALSGWGLGVAIAVLLAFAGFVIVMVTWTDEDEVEWTRLAWIFSSIEAIAFAAAGALFGSTVQRQRAETAEANAKKNATDAEKGRSLANQLKSEAVLDDNALEGASVAQRYARLAAYYFPDP